MANKRKRSKPKAPQRKSTRQCIRTDKYGGEYYDEHSMNTSVASPVGQGQPVAASSNDASGANCASSDNPVAPTATAEQGTLMTTTSVQVSDAIPIDIPTPVMLSTPSLAQEKSTTTPTCKENTPEAVLRHSCLKKPLNLQLELELAEQELAASFVVDTAHQPETNFDLRDSVSTVDQHKEDLQIDDDEFLTLCGFYELCNISPYGSECFRQIFDGVYHHVTISACFDIEDAVKPEVKCEENGEKERKRERERLEQMLIKEEQKSEELQQLLLKEQTKSKKLSADCENLQQQLFEKAQQQKVSGDRIRQLENDNTYRKEVQRLEEKIQVLEKERGDMIEDLKKQDEEISLIRGNMSDLMNENAVLKNAAKLKKQFLNSDTQTDTPEQCYSISVQTDECTDDMVQVACEKCAGDKNLTDDLIDSLETIERSVAYTQSLECEQSIRDIVGRLDAIEKSMSLTSKQQNNNPNSNTSNTIHPSGTAYIPSTKDTTLSKMNTFHPLQHVNNTHYQPYRPKQTENVQTLPLVPGPKLYSETVKGPQTTMILTDSMSGGVKAKCIKKNTGGKEGKIIFRRFPGHTAEDMAFYAPKPLQDQKPEHVIIIAGTNDLTRAMFESDVVDEFEVVESIMKIGRVAREQGAKKINISSVIIRRGFRYQEIVKKVNDVLYMACIAENFEFIDQDNITMAHISSDGVHLTAHGTVIMLFNILSVFSTFDRNFMDFKKDFEYAMSMS